MTNINIMNRNNKNNDGVELSIEQLTKLPVGCAYHYGWGGDDKKGYVELHPSPNLSPDAKYQPTVQVVVDQKSKTIHISGFPKSFKQDAINAWTFFFA